MKVLVVGGAGYVGSHTAIALREAGYWPVIYDNLSTGHKRLVRGFELIEGDIADRARLSHALHGVGAVLDFAGKAYVGESVEHPREYFETNVVRSIAMLNTMMDAGVKRLIFSSSCAVYGSPESLPITEDTPRKPINPYGATKAAFEDVLRAYAGAYGLSFAALRYFNAAGCDAEGRTGELHEPETHLIPCILRAAAGLSRGVTVYGTDYPTPDGTCVRDFIHVSDLATAHVSALNRLMREPCADVVNLGSGRGYSIGEVLACAEQVTGVAIQRFLAPRRAGDPPVLVSNADRARERLGWQAERSLWEMVESAWSFLLQERERLRTEELEAALPRALALDARAPVPCATTPVMQPYPKARGREAVA